MQIDYNAARFWLEVLLLLGNIGMYLYVWIDRGQRVGRARMEAMEAAAKTDFIRLSERLTGAEAKLAQVPTHDDLGRIYERIAKLTDSISEFKEGLSARLGEMKGEFRAVREGVSMIHQFLLEERKKS
jgi:hypothetical protein